jgi:hypothetical protein
MDSLMIRNDTKDTCMRKDNDIIQKAPKGFDFSPFGASIMVQNR